MNPWPGLTPFVGESRRLLVDGLVQVYDDVKHTGTSRWISLEAPSGWGKTRVGREFYARLAASQAEPTYWPRAIADRRRKVTHPEVIEREAGSVPEFLWWGIACSTRDDLPTNALIADLRQIEVHAPYVEAAWKQLVSRWERRQDQASQVGRMILEEGASETAAAAAQLVGTSIGLGLVVRLARWTKDALQEHREQEQLIAGDEVLRIAPSLDVIDDTVNILARASRLGLPIVLLIEDLHKADEVLLKFIDALLARVSHLLIISTILPDVPTQDATLANLFDHHSGHLHRVSYLEQAGAPFPDHAGLTALELTARAKILRSYYPEIERSTEQALLERYASPHDLEVVCQLPKHQKMYPTLQLDPVGIRRLPKGIRQLYEEWWNQLPRSMRLAMAVAAAIIPVNISPEESGGLGSWDKHLLRGVLNSLELPIATNDDSAIELDVNPNAYAWIRPIDDWLRSFADDSQLAIATDNGMAILDEELDDPRSVVLVELTAQLLLDRERTVSRIHGARTVLALRAEGFLAQDDIAATAILAILSDLADPPREVQERIRVYGRFCDLDPHTISASAAQAIQCRGADAFSEAGRVEEAIAIYRDLLADLRLVFQDDHPSSLAVQVRLAGLLGEAGGVDEAVLVLRHLLDDLERVLGNDHPTTLIARSNLAHWLGEAGRAEEAIAAYRELVDHEARVLGNEHSGTLTSRSNLARWMSDAGNLEEAISSGIDVVADQQRILGHDHPDTLTSRGNLAMARGQSGRAVEAIVLYEELLEDMRRVLGGDHPVALTSRSNLAGCLNEAGRVDEAIVVYEDLLEDQRRILGFDHPHTLATRNNLIGLPHAGVGRAETMIATCRELLRDEVRVFGDDHPTTLTTRGNLAEWLGKAGHAHDAIAAYQTLLIDLQRVLGTRHPTVLVARGSLAHWLGEAGHAEAALTTYQELLADQRRVLGEDHPDTLTVLDSLVGVLVQAGRLSEAITAYRELQAGESRVLGEDHPDTLTTRSNLAALLVQVGRVDEAIAMYENLLDDLRNALGDDHPTTLASRGNLAGLIGRIGRVDEAIAIYESLLDDLQRVLGDDHSTTLTIRRNLAYLLAEVSGG